MVDPFNCTRELELFVWKICDNEVLYVLREKRAFAAKADIYTASVINSLYFATDNACPNASAPRNSILAETQRMVL